MQETMTQLKSRAKSWPEPWGSHARELIRDAHFDLAFCQHKHTGRVVEDLHQALLATELEMQRDTYRKMTMKRIEELGEDDDAKRIPKEVPQLSNFP